MFEINTTQLVQTFQTMDPYYILSSMIGTTYLELLVFSVGIFLYAAFVWFFYKNLAKRDIFELNLSKYDMPEVKWRRVKKAGSTFLYILKYGIVFPFYVVFWFVILSIFLFVMAKDIDVRQIALISMALVSTVRITSYFKEELSHDLAKLFPLALLVIAVTERNFFSWNLLMNRLEAFPSLGWEILQFLTFSILLEWTLRILYSMKVAGSRRVKPTETLKTQ